jgi:phage tail sheath protein FI
MATLTLNSPGVFLQENDNSQVTAGPIAVGAAILGPTVKGPVGIPTVVTTYSDYVNKFGTTFSDRAGTNTEYLTSIAAFAYFQQGGESLLVSRIANGTYTPATASIVSLVGYTGSFTSGALDQVSQSYTDQTGLLTASFILETLSEGALMNNIAGANYDAITGSSFGQTGTLLSGSAENIRWEISSVNTGSGQFTLLIRRGDDTDNNKSILETWPNLSLDPNASNYIEYVIGNQKSYPNQDAQGNWFLFTSGSYPNASKYIRVRQVNYKTPNYLDSLGQPKSQYTASLPRVGTGAYRGGFATAQGVVLDTATTPLSASLFENIPVTVNLATNPIQGVVTANYTASLGLLSNVDQYSFNIIYAPGATLQNAPQVVNPMITYTQNRADAIAVIDLVGYNQNNLGSVVSEAQSIDSSYAAAYYPWVQLRSAETGKLLWCPASTVIPAAYEFNDRVGQPWFAPAGITRGSLSTVLQPERRLTVSDRDTLYNGKVNPIAVFPGQGTVIYGQKTLQAANTALNRVNVRRLLIELKNTIGQVANGLLFEPNSTATRNSFLNQVNPYLQSVQQKQGLFAFQVVMDETNNTPDVIDRNQLAGAIYLQPTKTSEFIVVDFNITPTGATFGA